LTGFWFLAWKTSLILVKFEAVNVRSYTIKLIMMLMKQKINLLVRVK